MKSLNLRELKELAAIGNPDILLIEGYKEEQGEKVVLLRDADGLGMRCSELDGIQLVVGCPEITAGSYTY